MAAAHRVTGWHRLLWTGILAGASLLAACSPAPAPTGSPSPSPGISVPVEQLPPDVRCLVEHGARIVEVKPPLVAGDPPRYELALDNVVEGAVYRGDDRRSAVERALALLEIFGLDVEPSRRAVDLSGGQAQRIALCRALLTNPPIILADEPTGNLDRGNAAVIERAFQEHVERGGLVIVATHNERLANRSHRVIRL